MNINAVIQRLNETIDSDINPSYYQNIEYWNCWAAGLVDSFHRYTETTVCGSKTRYLYTFQIAKKICQDFASLILNERTELAADDKNSLVFLVGEDEDQTGGIFKETRFWQQGNGLIEKAFSSGTGAFLMKLDGINLSPDGTGLIRRSADTRIRLEFLPAQCIVPISTANGKITECAFVSERMVKGRQHIYLEAHLLEAGTYVIYNFYFEMDKGDLVEAPLPVGILRSIQTGSKHPFFAIIKPNIVNIIPDNLGLGCAIYHDSIDVLKGVDIAYNNFVRDLRLSGKKVFVARELTQIKRDVDGKIIQIMPDDIMQSLFVQMGEQFSNDKKPISEFNPDLRVSDNQRALQAMLDYIAFKCGLGLKFYKLGQDFGSKIPITATQWTGENQQMRQNISKHSIIVWEAIQDISKAILWAAANVLGKKVNPEANVVAVAPDGYIEDEDVKRAKDLELLKENVIQKWEFRKKWLHESEADAKERAKDNTVSEQEAHDSILVQNGVMTINDYRAKWKIGPPLPGGDVPNTQINQASAPNSQASKQAEESNKNQEPSKLTKTKSPTKK